MNTVRFSQLDTVLCIGAHGDDIEIGAGATIRRLLRERPSIRICWVVLSAQGIRAEEARASARAYLRETTPHRPHEVIVRGYRDGYFPQCWADLKGEFEAIRSAVEPDLVLTHCGGDRHQDHRTVSELTWNTFRAHTILEFEIPKYDADLGAPNVFFVAEDADARGKVELLRECFPSQAGKHWFDELTFLGLMRLRGLECRSPTGLAEAFYGRKVIY
jgi:LmbE family N-acetylglucosaminyl deacetylase